MPMSRAALRCGPQPPAAEARKRAPQAASEITRLRAKYPIATNSAADWNKQLAATREDEEKRCSGRPRLVEINTGDSRASRSPATRRLAILAPLASARKYLLHRYRNRESVANYKNAERQKPPQKQTIPFNPPTPLHRQRTAESTNHTDKEP